MGIASIINDNTFTISISGRFDFGIHKDFRAAMDSIDGAGITNIVVDMARTEYVDSSALGMLLMLKSKMGDKKEAISLRNASPEVKKILDIANFGQLFTLA